MTPSIDDEALDALNALPDWARQSPALAGIYLEIENFRTNVMALGADFEEARQRAIRLIQDGMTWQEARDAVLKSIAFGTFS